MNTATNIRAIDSKVMSKRIRRAIHAYKFNAELERSKRLIVLNKRNRAKILCGLTSKATGYNWCCHRYSINSGVHH